MIMSSRLPMDSYHSEKYFRKSLFQGMLINFVIILILVYHLKVYDNVTRENKVRCEQLCQSPFQGTLRLKDMPAQPGSQLIAPNIAREYKDYSKQNMEGWMSPIHHDIVGQLAEYQHGHLHMAGLVGEIGVHHGKFFYSLASTLREGERGIAFDLFDDQDLNVDKSGKGSRAKFVEHGEELGFVMGEDVQAVQADSTSLTQDDLYQISDYSYRMLSVDGGHTREITVNDLMLAEKMVHPSGVVILVCLWSNHLIRSGKRHELQS